MYLNKQTTLPKRELVEKFSLNKKEKKVDSIFFGIDMDDCALEGLEKFFAIVKDLSQRKKPKKILATSISTRGSRSLDEKNAECYKNNTSDIVLEEIEEGIKENFDGTVEIIPPYYLSDLTLGKELGYSYQYYLANKSKQGYKDTPEYKGVSRVLGLTLNGKDKLAMEHYLTYEFYEENREFHFLDDRVDLLNVMSQTDRVPNETPVYLYNYVGKSGFLYNEFTGTGKHNIDHKQTTLDILGWDPLCQSMQLFKF